MHIRTLLIGVLAVAAAPAAHATVYDWTLSSDGTHDGSGTLTTSGTSPDIAIAMDGAINGNPVTGVDAPGTAFANDNVVTYPGVPVDGNGLLVSTDGLGALSISSFDGAEYVSNGANLLMVDFEITPAAAPEPAVPVLLATALAGIALARRRTGPGRS